MTLFKNQLVVILLYCSLLLAASPLRAQEEPKPAGTSANPFPLINDLQDQNNPNTLTPDLTPITGVELPTLGSPKVVHSYWQTGLQWAGSIQSNSYNQTANSNWLINDFFAGTLSVLKAWSSSQLAMNYSAGGFVSSNTAQGNGYYQQLAFTQTIQRKHWTFQIIDQFSYLPQTSLGFGGGTDLGLPGTGGSLGPVIPGLGNNYVPDQTIFSAVGPRYSNTSSLQVTYATTPHGSITVSGTYGLLDFIDAGNVDSQTITGTIGYNYALTPSDSIGAYYRFSAFHFTGQPEAYGDHSASFVYSRRITGRIALQLFAGPDFRTSRISPNGNSTAHDGNVGANLSYGFEKGGFSVGFSRGTYGGSGVLVGSVGDILNFGANRRLTRIWSGQINGNYAHNSSIPNSLQTTPQPVSQSFNTWNAGGGVSRPVGRNATFAVAYNAIHTDYGLAGCVGAACSSSQITSYVTINVSWRTRPFVLP